MLVILNVLQIGTLEGSLPLDMPHWRDLEQNLAGEEQPLFLDFIESLLKWLPEDRPTAKQALAHPWLIE